VQPYAEKIPQFKSRKDGNNEGGLRIKGEKDTRDVSYNCRLRGERGTNYVGV